MNMLNVYDERAGLKSFHIHDIYYLLDSSHWRARISRICVYSVFRLQRERVNDIERLGFCLWAMHDCLCQKSFFGPAIRQHFANDIRGAIISPEHLFQKATHTQRQREIEHKFCSWHTANEKSCRSAKWREETAIETNEENANSEKILDENTIIPY